MATDLRGLVVQAATNALQQSTRSAAPPQPAPKKPHISTGRAMMLGAGLMAAGQALAKPRGRELIGSVRDRLIEARHPGDEEFDDDEYEDEYEDDDEPEAEADEDFDDADEDDLEDQDEDFEDEDFDEEPEDDEEYEDEDEEPESASRSRSRSGSRA